METRIVQKTGKSTLVVSLPKKWAKSYNIANGSLLFLSQNQNGELLLSYDKPEQDSIMKLNIGDMCGEPLIRDIIACYLAGYKTIEISSLRLTAMQKEDLRLIVNKLIGPEVLEETSNKMTIRDLLRPEELQSDRVLKRIKNVTRGMIQDALFSFIKQDKKLAMDVIERDNEVDRLNLLIARQFSESLIFGRIKDEPNRSLSILNYMQAAKNMEHIADNALMIAKISAQIDYDLPSEASKYLSTLSSSIADLLDDCISSLLNPNICRANQLIDKTQGIETQSLIMTRSLWEKCSDEIQTRQVIAVSIERMLEHIKNIAELSINLHNSSL